MLSCFSMFEIVVYRRASDEATERHRWQPNNNAGPRISRARRAPGVTFFFVLCEKLQALGGREGRKDRRAKNRAS